MLKKQSTKCALSSAHKKQIGFEEKRGGAEANKQNAIAKESK